MKCDMPTSLKGIFWLALNSNNKKNGKNSGMCECVCVHIHIYTHYSCIYIYVFIYSSICINIHVCICRRMRVCIHIYTHLCIHTVYWRIVFLLRGTLRIKLLTRQLHFAGLPAPRGRMKLKHILAGAAQRIATVVSGSEGPNT